MVVVVALLVSCSVAEELTDVLVVEPPKPARLNPLPADDLSSPDVLEAFAPANPESELVPSFPPPAARLAREGDDAVEPFAASFRSPILAPAPALPVPALESPASPPPERNVNPAVPGRPRFEPVVVVVTGDPDGCESIVAGSVVALLVLAPAAKEEDASPTRDRRGGALLVLALASCESDDPDPLPPPGVAEIAVRDAIVVVVDVEVCWAREASDLRGAPAPVPTPSPELVASCDNDGELPVLPPTPAAASDERDALGVDEEEVARLARDLRGGALLFAAS